MAPCFGLKKKMEVIIFFKMIPYTKHNINNSDIKAVVKVLKSKNLTQGPEIELLENPTNEPTEQIVSGGTFKDD